MMTSRNKILWIGGAPDSNLVREFTNRELTLDHVRPNALDGDLQRLKKSLCQARGIVFCHNQQKFLRTQKFLELVTNVPVSYSGVRTCILVKDLDDINKILPIFGGSGAQPQHGISFEYIKSLEYPSFAQSFARHDPRSSPNPDLIINEDEPLKETHRVLLQRSFSDCKSIVIRKMSQGRSATVVTVYPIYLEPNLGGHSLPYIAKFDIKSKIANEINYYNDYVIHHVPFNLRPGVDNSRCFNDCEEGIIVANFVDRSISLLEAIKRGAGPQALHSLFEEALESWFHNAETKHTHPFLSLQPIGISSTNNQSAERNRFRARKFESEVFDQAKRYGSVLEPSELLECIRKIPCDSYLSGISHRDLHTKNVLVKGNDAIVIDYAKTDEGPVLLDMATLDVSIAFDAVPTKPKMDEYKVEVHEKYNSKFEEECNEWKTFVYEIFEKANVIGLPPQKNGHELRAREWACIRQVRRLALSSQKNDNEYAICIAVELMRCSTLKSKAPQIRAYAYYLADRLIRSLDTLPKIRAIQ